MKIKLFIIAALIISMLTFAGCKRIKHYTISVYNENNIKIEEYTNVHVSSIHHGRYDELLYLTLPNGKEVHFRGCLVVVTPVYEE